MADVIFENTLPIPASKSMMNRLLICQSYFPSSKVEGANECDDVTYLKQCLSDLNQKTFFVGDGGTTFRFLALRLSRYPGKHIIEMGDALKRRPHADLYSIFDQVHISYELKENQLIIEGGEWHLSDGIEVNTSISSQYLSSLLLNAWLLDEKLKIYLDEEIVSKPYFEMTLKTVEYLGMNVEKNENGISISAGQKIIKDEVTSELDMSCAFTVASLGTVHHGVEIDPFYYPSLQADSQFLAIFEEMGIPFMYSDQSLKVFPVKEIKPIDCDLNDSPDLFPVLAVLCSIADGKSKLYGAEHLRWKESNRIEATSRLLKIIDCPHEILDDGMIIEGSSSNKRINEQDFHAEEDHRMAFAAALAKLSGHNIKIHGADCVNKSFKHFWTQFTENFASDTK